MLVRNIDWEAKTNIHSEQLGAPRCHFFTFYVFFFFHYKTALQVKTSEVTTELLSLRLLRLPP